MTGYRLEKRRIEGQTFQVKWWNQNPDTRVEIRQEVKDSTSISILMVKCFSPAQSLEHPRLSWDYWLASKDLESFHRTALQQVTDEQRLGLFLFQKPLFSFKAFMTESNETIERSGCVVKAIVGKGFGYLICKPGTLADYFPFLELWRLIQVTIEQADKPLHCEDLRFDVLQPLWSEPLIEVLALTIGEASSVLNRQEQLFLRRLIEGSPFLLNFSYKPW